MACSNVCVRGGEGVGVYSCCVLSSLSCVCSVDTCGTDAGGVADVTVGMMYIHWCVAGNCTVVSVGLVYVLLVVLWYLLY